METVPAEISAPRAGYSAAELALRGLRPNHTAGATRAPTAVGPSHFLLSNSRLYRIAKAPFSFVL